MVRMWTFGDNKVWLESPDIIRLVNVGVFDLKLLHELNQVALELSATHPRLYLISDVRRGTSISADARKTLSENPEAMPFVGTVLFGASFALRTMANMMGRASALLGRTQGAPFGMVETEEEARGWVAAQRALQGAARAS
ncbi:STAS/SEC14 domain-containing protein [Myxococcus sp. CA051A]|uniref:STAS/SEC14 domain-containing protein n=1 Tax=unclassified Myxococcus TaxID=2648731 RepID=UPI00157A5483|nr:MULTISPECIES: STAS/SEC14 domain-containing protein [unclassified Myxococcus]NTX53773.1 STAS/SEC14 domain-containing protein [Myxococcus sp. CA039A]NTX61906.1 STAS/SEC14 domain-containing protein [Myxococcus sp. CA051A]